MTETSDQGPSMSVPPPPTPAPAPSSGPRPALIGAVAAILVLAVAGMAFAAAQMTAPGRTADVHPYQQPDREGLRDRGVPRLPLVEQRHDDRLRLRGALMGGARGITISAIDGSNLTLTAPDGWTRTITVTDSATIRRAGQTITLADLKVGDEIRLVQERNADGTVTITAIEVVVPHVLGRVTATTADSITIERPDGTTMTIHVGATTAYQVRGVQNATLADISVGMVIVAQGTQDADGTLEALAVYGAAAH
jgi:hypothetical protein